MSSELLHDAIQDFLDAEIMLEQRRAEAGDTKSQRQAFEQAKRRLMELLSGPARKSPDPLVKPAQEYIAAVCGFERRARFREWRLGEAMFPPPGCAARSAAGAPQSGQKIDGLNHSASWHQKRLLVAVDGSQPSAWATEVARSLALELEASVRLVHVIASDSEEGFEQPAVEEALQEQEEQQGKAILRAARSRFPVDITVATLLRHGNVTIQIANAARRWAADFIVMGTRGHGRIARFLLGSTAASVIRLAPCPVITVSHEPPGFTADAMQKNEADDVINAGI